MCRPTFHIDSEFLGMKIMYKRIERFGMQKQLLDWYSLIQFKVLA